MSSFTLVSDGEWSAFDDVTIGRTFLYLDKPWVKITEYHAACLLDNCMFRLPAALRVLLVQFRPDTREQL